MEETVTDEALLNRLRKVEGQVRGIIRMVEEERYCIDVVNQITAARGALARVAMLVTHRHLNRCVKQAMAEGRGEVLTAELMDSLKKFVKQ